MPRAPIVTASRHFLAIALLTLPALAAECPGKRALLELTALGAGHTEKPAGRILRFTVRPLFESCSLEALPPIRVTLISARTGRKTHRKIEADDDGIYQAEIPESGGRMMVLFRSGARGARLTKVPYLLVGGP